MSKTPNARWKKEEVVQAVVIADTFNDHFTPFSLTFPPCLLPLGNCPLLEYTLNCLASGGVDEVILFCTLFPEQIKLFISKKNFGDLTVTVVVSELCRSFGDAMRDLDTKALLRSDFILVTGYLVSNFQFEPLLKKHSEFRKLDQSGQSIAMTLLFKDGGKRANSNDEITFATDSTTNRILWLNKKHNASSKVKIPLEIVVTNDLVDIYHGLLDTKIYICSSSVPPLFADNFDFETIDDFVRGLLINEDILASTLYCHTLTGKNYASTVSNWIDYQTVTHDLIHRWVYPVVPDAGFAYSYQRHNVYQAKDITLSFGCQLIEDVMIGNGCSIGENTLIDNSVVGENCRIGKNVKLEGCYLFNNVVVEDNCTLSYCVIGDRSLLKTGCSVIQGSILGPDVVVDSGKTISDVRVQSVPFGSGDDGKLSSKAFACNTIGDNSVSDSDSDNDDSFKKKNSAGPGLLINLDIQNEFEDDVLDSSESDERSSDGEFSEVDDTKIFYDEVCDSLVRGYSEKLPCDNLILEINSSRYAYNVTVKEVNSLVMKAILNLPNHEIGGKVEKPSNFWEELKNVINYFDPVLKKYIKSTDSQKDCLIAIEDVAETVTKLFDVTMQLLNFLYHQDILYPEAIDWWYENPPPTEFADVIRKKVERFVLWLREESTGEESSESN